MFEQNLKSMLEELTAAAGELQENLLSRDADRIMQGLNRQEETLNRLGGLFQEQDLNVQEILQRDPALKSMLKKCQQVVHSNRSLAQRFLEVINQTFARLSGGTSVAYAGGYGSMPQRSTPILVRQQG